MARHSDQSKRDDKSQSSGGKKDDVSNRKKNLTLDFQAVQAKRGRLDMPPVLESPDMKKLKLKSPELEHLILQQNPLNGATPTPSTTQILFPKIVTEAQEDYAKGFEDALNELHGSESSQMGGFDVSSNSSSNMTYTDLDPSSRPTGFNLSSLQLVIKDEPQTVPSMGDSPHLSPIDMECQEKIKLERKRQRNRVAASKCRRRKLERIARLEDKVKMLKNENSDLSMFLHNLKDQVSLLKAQVLDHVSKGCEIMTCMQ